MQTALAAQQEVLLLSRLPPWVNKTTCVLSEPRGFLQLGFYCCCADHKQQIKVRVDKCSSVEAKASKLADSVQRKHGACQHSSGADRTGSTIPKSVDSEPLTTTQLERVVVGLKRKVAAHKTQAELAIAKAAKCEAAVSENAEIRRQESRQDGRRLPIDLGNREVLGSANKHTAMTTSRTGMLDSIKLWSRGSIGAVQELIIALIEEFKLQEEVATELSCQHSTAEARRHKTNDYIVQRARQALQTLKQCSSEQQRQEYRIVLTALAPEKGQIQPVANALGVHRNSNPMKAAVQKRAQIDAQVQESNKPLKVGDTVQCRHGTGVLVEYSEDPALPCAVQLQIGAEYVHTSKFQRSDKNKGGARVRRVPITFKHDHRHTRSDGVTADVVQKVQQFYEDECATSPCAKDKVRKRVGPKMYLTAQKLYMLDTYAELYRKFKDKYPTVKLSDRKFEMLAPWNISTSKQETCCCKACENFSCYEEAVAKALSVVSSELLQGCEEESELPEEQLDPILSDPNYKALHQIHQMSRRIDKVKRVLCEGSFEAGRMGCIDPHGCEHDEACSSCGFKQIWSQGLRPLLVLECDDGDAQLHPGIHPVWLSQIRWTRYKTEKGVDKETLRHECTGSIIELLDEFESVFNKYQYHRYILQRTKDSNEQFEQNATPGMLKMDVDWAENYTMIHAREIQSEYWTMKQMSLFICIGKMLMKAEWDAMSGQLEVGSEVTVQLPTGDSFWASVVSGSGAEADSQYTVEDRFGVHFTVQRSVLRARVWHTIAQVGTTNDKKHDSYATQHFMTKMIEQWQQFHDPISSLHIHSDNAGSHFKNSRTLNYLSRLKTRLRVKVTWSFGCPGHGKGPWDGFGGLMKRVLRRDTIDGNIVLLNYQQASAHLRKRFCSEQWTEQHKVEHFSKHRINRVVIIEADSSEIDRQQFEEYESVNGIRKSFGYMALDGARVLQRWFDCWCVECMKADGPGLDSMNSNYQVTGCTCKEPWWECSVQLKGVRGIRAQQQIAQKNGRELAHKLKPDTFIAVQDRRDQDHRVPFLIGVTVDRGGGSCIVEEVQGRKSIEGTSFTNGDIAIAVKWLRRLDEDPEQRTFEWVVDVPEFVVNSTELRLSNIELDRVQPLGAPIRRSARAIARAQSSSYTNSKPVQYSISPQTEQAILNMCW